MMATSGTSVVRACTARTASGIILPVCRPAPAAQRLVAAEAAAELLRPHVEWGEVERWLGHVASTPAPGCGVSAPPAPRAPSTAVGLGPNNAVPKRITVAPSSSAVP